MYLQKKCIKNESETGILKQEQKSCCLQLVSVAFITFQPT